MPWKIAAVDTTMPQGIYFTVQAATLAHCGNIMIVGPLSLMYLARMVWYGMVDVCDGYLAAEASGSSFG